MYKKDKVISILLIVVIVLSLFGCGPSKAELQRQEDIKVQERERIAQEIKESEERLEKETQEYLDFYSRSTEQISSGIKGITALIGDFKSTDLWHANLKIETDKVTNASEEFINYKSVPVLYEPVHHMASKGMAADLKAMELLTSGFKLNDYDSIAKAIDYLGESGEYKLAALKILEAMDK